MLISVDSDCSPSDTISRVSTRSLFLLCLCYADKGIQIFIYWSSLCIIPIKFARWHQDFKFIPPYTMFTESWLSVYGWFMTCTSGALSSSRKVSHWPQYKISRQCFSTQTRELLNLTKMSLIKYFDHLKNKAKKKKKCKNDKWRQCFKGWTMKAEWMTPRNSHWQNATGSFTVDLQPLMRHWKVKERTPFHAMRCTLYMVLAQHL